MTVWNILADWGEQKSSSWIMSSSRYSALYFHSHLPDALVYCRILSVTGQHVIPEPFYPQDRGTPGVTFQVFQNNNIMTLINPQKYHCNQTGLDSINYLCVNFDNTNVVYEVSTVMALKVGK